jgi:hypothetical protein
MTVHGRRWFLGLLAGAVGCTAGCDLGSLMYFLMPDARENAVMKGLAEPKDSKKSPKVVILTYSGLETRAEFVHADRQLADLLGRQLAALAQANEEQLAIVPVRKVEEFKSNRSNWREMDLPAIGRHFQADYVVYLEINSLSLYEKGSANQLFRGRADINITLIDVNNPDETRQEPFTCTYPSDARGPVQVGFDANPLQFRQAFLGYVAKRLSWYFSRYPKRDTAFDEGPSRG